MNDLALGSIVLALAAVPAALLVLLLADVVKLDGAGRRQRWIRRSAAVLAILALPSVGNAVWGWAGAAHLEPSRGSTRVPVRTLFLLNGN